MALSMQEGVSRPESFAVEDATLALMLSATTYEYQHHQTMEKACGSKMNRQMLPQLILRKMIDG
jgi:hypothetical protein